MSLTIDQQSEMLQAVGLEAARAEFAYHWFGDQALDSEDVTRTLVDYINAVHAEVTPLILANPNPSEMTFKIYKEAESVAAYCRSNRQPMSIVDTDARFMEYIRDETAVSLGEQRVSALPRAITLTLMDQLESML